MADKARSQALARRRNRSVSVSARGRKAARTVSETKHFFTALDGADVGVSKSHWRIEVYSVADRARRRWVQIGIRGSHPRMLMLRLNRHEGPRTVLRTLETWLANPTEKPAIVWGNLGCP